MPEEPTRSYKFIGARHKIPQGAIVQIVKFYPKRRALVLYQGEKILTFSTLLRKLPEVNP